MSYQEGHPSPGEPFQGGVFEAYFPDSERTRRLLPGLEKAFKRGLTFTVKEKETGAKAKVTWNCIPHKTSLQGGRSGWVEPLGQSMLSWKSSDHTVPLTNSFFLVSFRCGYPDSSYLSFLEEVLSSHGIDEPPGKLK